MRTFRVGDVEVGHDFLFILGPCVLQEEAVTDRVAHGIAEVCARVGAKWMFKASFDKANRTSMAGARGPGLNEGLRALSRLRSRLGVPITTDVHLAEQAAPVGEVVDLLQVPAFLCRQTDLLLACAATGKPVNVKKGQFMAPGQMRGVVSKLADATGVLLTERGVSFGYHDLVVDMRALVQMRELGVPVCFDATHSVQSPGGQGDTTGGDRRFAPMLARAAAAVGIDVLFAEVHDDPASSPSDAANMLHLDSLEATLRDVLSIRAAVAAASPSTRP